MHFATFLVVALGALVNAATSAENPITPIEGPLTAGKPTTIKWTPTTAGTVTLQLRSGPANNLGPGTVIASSIPNSGSYSWTPSADLPSAANYAIQIANDAYPSTQVNYSPQFSISGSSSSTSVPSTTSASSTTSTSSMTGNSTTTTTSASLSATKNGTTTTTASKTTTSAANVPGSASNAGYKIGQGVAAVIGVGVFVVGL